MALIDAYLLLIELVREIEAAEKKAKQPQPNQPAPAVGTQANEVDNQDDHKNEPG